METLNSRRKVASVGSFNFLASLINGNAQQSFSQSVFCQNTFNFLASLINGNEGNSQRSCDVETGF